MYSYIKKLQSKEEIVRKQILAGLLAVSMTIVGFVWVYSLSDRFSNKQVATVDASSGTKPFKLFSNSVASAYQSITASVGNFSFSNKNVAPEQKQIDLIVVDHPSAQ